MISILLLLHKVTKRTAELNIFISAKESTHGFHKTSGHACCLRWTVLIHGFSAPTNISMSYAKHYFSSFYWNKTNF